MTVVVTVTEMEVEGSGLGDKGPGPTPVPHSHSVPCRQSTDLVGEGLPGQVCHRLHLGTEDTNEGSGAGHTEQVVTPAGGASYLVVHEELRQHEEEAESIHP